MGVVCVCKRSVRYVGRNSQPKHIILSIVVIRAGNKHENRSTRNITTNIDEKKKYDYVGGAVMNSPQQVIINIVA